MRLRIVKDMRDARKNAEILKASAFGSLPRGESKTRGRAERARKVRAQCKE